jgi:hypothetical protein
MSDSAAGFHAAERVTVALRPSRVVARTTVSPSNEAAVGAFAMYSSTATSTAASSRRGTTVESGTLEVEARCGDHDQHDKKREARVEDGEEQGRALVGAQPPHHGADSPAWKRDTVWVADASNGIPPCPPTPTTGGNSGRATVTRTVTVT